MTFSEWFEQEFWQIDEDERFVDQMRRAWEAGFQSGRDHQLELERLAAYDRSVFGDH